MRSNIDTNSVQRGRSRLPKCRSWPAARREAQVVARRASTAPELQRHDAGALDLRARERLRAHAVDLHQRARGRAHAHRDHQHRAVPRRSSSASSIGSPSGSPTMTWPGAAGRAGARWRGSRPGPAIARRCRRCRRAAPDRGSRRRPTSATRRRRRAGRATRRPPLASSLTSATSARSSPSSASRARPTAPAAR